MAVGREPAHVDADLGDHHLAREGLDARDRAQLFDGGAKGRDVGLHLLVNLSDGGFKRIDLPEMQAEQKAMLLGDAAAQSCGQLCRRRLHAAIGKGGELAVIGLAVNHCLDHRAAALAHDVRDHRIQFDVGILERLLHALDVA
jgi:hypothetical protein